MYEYLPNELEAEPCSRIALHRQWWLLTITCAVGFNRVSTLFTMLMTTLRVFLHYALLA
jgi:hypothetical protein